MQSDDERLRHSRWILCPQLRAPTVPAVQAASLTVPTRSWLLSIQSKFDHAFTIEQGQFGRAVQHSFAKSSGSIQQPGERHLQTNQP